MWQGTLHGVASAQLFWLGDKHIGGIAYGALNLLGAKACDNNCFCIVNCFGRG
jgi:hypothetical protein